MSGPPGADRRVALCLGACALLLYLVFWTGYLKSTDESAVYETARALYERADLAIPASGPHVFAGRDGRSYGHFSVGQSVLLLPFLGLGRLAEAALPDPWVAALAGPVRPGGGAPQGGGTIGIAAASLYGPFAAAVLVAVFFLFERRLGASLRSALAASVLLATTSYVAVMSGYTLRHTTEAVVILFALQAWYGYARSGRRRQLALGSVAASSLLLVSLPAAIVGPALGAYLLAVLHARKGDHRSGAALARSAAAVALPLAVALTALLLLNRSLWGTWLESPMTAQRGSFGTPFYFGAWGHLLSPGGSIFLYSPLLLLAPTMLRHFATRHRAECWTFLAIGVVLLVVHSTFWSWTGLWSAPGPRYLFLVVPLFLLPLGPWLDAGLTARARCALVALASIGAVVQLVVLSASWDDVIVSMGYRTWAGPRYEFMFLPDHSPILGSAWTVARGDLAPWLATLARGWPGFAPAPGAAVLLFLLWLAAFAAALFTLARALGAHPERREAARRAAPATGRSTPPS